MFETGTSSWWGRLGSATKVAVAATAALLTMTAAVAAALVVPAGGDGGSEPAVLRSATVAGGKLVAPTSVPPTAANGQAGGEASVPAPTGSPAPAGQASGRVNAAVAPSAAPLPSVPLPTVPTSLPDMGGSLPDLSGLANIPSQVMACLEPIFDLVSSMPSIPSMDGMMQIGPTIVSCITGIVANLPLPSGMNACVSEIMGFVHDLMAQLPSGMPDIGGLDIAACIPSELPVPTGFSGFPGGGFPFSR